MSKRRRHRRHRRRYIKTSKSNEHVNDNNETKKVEVDVQNNSIEAPGNVQNVETTPRKWIIQNNLTSQTSPKAIVVTNLSLIFEEDSIRFGTTYLATNLNNEKYVGVKVERATQTELDDLKSVFVKEASKITFQPYLNVQKSSEFCGRSRTLNRSPVLKSHLKSINKKRLLNSVSVKQRRPSYLRTNKQRLHYNDLQPKSNYLVSLKAIEHNLMKVPPRIGRFLNPIRVFHQRYTAKLASKFIELCSWLGLTINRSLLAISKRKSKVFTQHNDLNENERNKQHQLEIIPEVDVKICEESKQQTNNSGDIEEMRQDLHDLKTKYLELFEMFNDFKKNGRSACAPPPPPPPMAPPPPPPLPPPMPVSQILKLPKARTPRNSLNGSKENESVRPIISLDDILNVKLRKTDKQSRITQHRASVPNVAPEIKQVKLRPTSRPQTPSFTDISNSPDIKSPTATLSRLIKKDEPNEK